MSECVITMRKKFTFSSRADVYYLAIMVNYRKRKCRIFLVYLKFKFVPWNEKKNRNLIQKHKNITFPYQKIYW